jgi:hypothetical protein
MVGGSGEQKGGGWRVEVRAKKGRSVEKVYRRKKNRAMGGDI